MNKKPIYRLAGLFLLVSMLVGTNLVVRATAQSAPATASARIFNPAADAYVIQTSRLHKLRHGGLAAGGRQPNNA